MNIIAKAIGENVFLIDAGDDQGQVYDADTKSLSPKMPMISLMTKNEWDFEGPFPKELENK